MYNLYIKKLLLLTICLSGSTIFFAQSDTPCDGLGAPLLTVGTTCSFTTGTTIGATQETNANSFGSPGCGGFSKDVWYSFIAPSSGDVTITTETGNITDGVMSLYSSNCTGTYNELACTDDVNGSMPEIVSDTLVAGEIYYIRFWAFGGSSTGTFRICVIDNSPLPPPSNDVPCDAISLTVGNSCNFSTYTNENATNSTVANPTCGNYNGGDVWFTVVAPASGHLIIDTDTDVIDDAGMAVYSGSCGALTEIICESEGSSNAAEMPLIQLTTLTAGETYYIRVWEYGNDNQGTFRICAYDGGELSGCSGSGGGVGGGICAEMIPFCTNETYCFTAQVGATAESGNEYDCLSRQPDPTWYYFEISTAGDLIFDITASEDIDFAVWGPFTDLATATTQCGSLGLPVDCSFSPDPTEQAEISGVNVGEVYILVVTNYAREVQKVTIQTATTNTAATNCAIVPTPNCDADAGNW